MEFVAVDVETANADYASICQIGIAHFDETGIREGWTTLIDPEDYFDGMNVSIHGIDETTVAGAPLLPDVFPEISARLSDRIVVHHMPFDRVAIARAAERYGLPALQAEWLDSAKVVRRTWDEFSQKGYGLANVAAALDIPLDHHDALSDATASGLIIQRAVETSGIGVQQWLLKARDPVGSAVPRSGDPSGPLYGECIVFTGALEMPRRKAAELAAAAGCDVASSVSKHVTLLVVGTQDLRQTDGQNKSSKHRKAEQLIEQGRQISIIGEEDFLALISEVEGPDST